jgi:hypothetical protein
MNDFKEHGVRLYLSKDLYTAFIRLQADKGLGRSYAGLLPFTEGMYRLGYISKEVYEEHTKKYSEQLVQSKPLTIGQLEEKEKLDRLRRQFSSILKQGLHTLSVKSRQYWIRKADEYKEKIPDARLILTSANGEAGSQEERNP